MKILYGLKSGALLQRDTEDVCQCRFKVEAKGELGSTLGTLTDLGKGEYLLSGIPIGGPYALTLYDDESSLTLRDLYVGDLWLLAGQSNMEGAGRMTYEDDLESANPLPYLRAFYMNDEWGTARPQLHQLFLSEDEAHKNTWESNVENRKERGLVLYDEPPYLQRRGVGPGYYFAKEMFRLTDCVPQGVIPAAVGGAPIEKWLPTADGGENYYTAACRRIEESGGNIRGVFWSQGEGNPNADIYPSQIRAIREDLASRTGKAEIPLVQMQSCRFTGAIGDIDSDTVWNRFREMQRTMPSAASCLATVATNDLELDDLIHLSSDAQKKAGRRAALAMNYLLTGRGHKEPMFDRAYVTKDRYVSAFAEVHVRYENVSGDLRASGVPSGFALRKRDDNSAACAKTIRRTVLCQNEVILRVEIPREELMEYELWYGYGNGFYCNITDGEDRAIPSMGPISINSEL